MAQALYRKWRPADFDELVGQEHVTTTLRNAIAAGRVSHAYLFAGPRGTGKTSAARLLAKAVNCSAPDPAARPCGHCPLCQAVAEGRLLDLIEIDAASNTGVDNIRDLRDKIGFAPSEGRYKVYVIDEAHQLSSAAFNALLKTLEEPPAHVIFVLATTEVHKLPATVTSRCQRFTFRRLPTSAVVGRLQTLCEREGLQAEPEALTLIARHATGSLRDAISLLDQLITGPGDTISLARAQALLGSAGSARVNALVEAWLAASPGDGLDAIAAALDDGSDPRQFARQVVDHLRQLLMLKLGGPQTLDLPADALASLRPQAARAELPRLLGTLRRWQSAGSELRTGWQPQLPLELAFIESLLPAGEEPAAGAAAAEPEPARSARGRSPAHPAARPAASQPGAREAASHEAASHEAASREAEPDHPAGGTAAGTAAAHSPAAGSAAESGAAAGGAAAGGAAASGAPPGGPPPAALSLQQVAARWDEVLAAVRARNRNLVALVREGVPAAVEGQTLVLAFRHSFHKERVAEERVRALLNDTLAQVLGVALHVRCVLESDTLAAPGARGSGGSGGSGGDDELVAWARNELGADVQE